MFRLQVGLHFLLFWICFTAGTTPTFFTTTTVALMTTIIASSTTNSAAVSSTPDGTIQTPGVGQYCGSYFGGISYSNIIGPNNFCYVTFCDTTDSFPSGCCPWKTSGSCSETYIPSTNEYDLYNYACAAGCIYTSPCAAIANGVFTSAGTNSNNCAFTCNAGYTASGRLCIATGPMTTTVSPTTTIPATTSTSACAAGSFKNGTSCSLCGAGTFTNSSNQLTSCNACAVSSYATGNGASSCQACTPCASSDQFLMGCGGGSAGICSYCDSSV